VRLKKQRQRTAGPYRFSECAKRHADLYGSGDWQEPHALGFAPLYVQAFPRRGRPASRPWAKRKPIRVSARRLVITSLFTCWQELHGVLGGLLSALKSTLFGLTCRQGHSPSYAICS
jgi:hypothetical protein